MSALLLEEKQALCDAFTARVDRSFEVVPATPAAGCPLSHRVTEVNILNRPAAVAERKQFDHWECDLIQFRQKFGKANVTSLVERVSRFVVLLRNNDRQSKPIMDKLIGVLQCLPYLARRSITFDRGTEFTDWPYLQAGIGAQTWFCDPQSPWQKGTAENTNGRARKWLSREVKPLSITEPDLVKICNRLNSTPRKCLAYKASGAGIIAELVARGTKPAVAANGAFSFTVKQARSSQRKLAASGSWLVKFPT
jgi:IS30 family transposase